MATITANSVKLHAIKNGYFYFRSTNFGNGESIYRFRKGENDRTFYSERTVTFKGKDRFLKVVFKNAPVVGEWDNDEKEFIVLDGREAK